MNGRASRLLRRAASRQRLTRGQRRQIKRGWWKLTQRERAEALSGKVTLFHREALRDRLIAAGDGVLEEYERLKEQTT